ncbi:NAC domain-containing protein 104-like [Durio zibethinus]|uniref:NAC domain-containing protein 104-like n=1 Tax=Durio zibethinus TaxID=66656 RepID=A0A6P6B9D3_DURZI|nr:NAC domain-containing protein 104-like [Durio zibethinus]
MEIEDGCFNQLPPGFQFRPTDEELVLHFLYPRAMTLPAGHPSIIPELDIHLLHPWELDGKALLSGNQYFFFSQMMENRTRENGYWKQLDIEEPIFSTGAGKTVGVKKLFVFFIGEAPLGVETNWLMQEYHLCDWGSALTSYYKKKGNKKFDCSKWVLCRVEESKRNAQSFSYNDEADGTELSCLDEMFLSLDDDCDDISSSKLLGI